jgi:orotate phosphoribosyltransferase
MNWNYRSAHDLSVTASRLAARLPRDAIIVGIPTSGVILAAMIATQLRVPYLDLPSYLEGATPWAGLRTSSAEAIGNHCVIVDDSVNSGTENGRVRNAIRTRRPESKERQFIYVAGYASLRGTRFVDLYDEILPLPRIFEWNLLHHKSALAETMMDIDGVLCRDPTAKENDDSHRYRRFLQSVSPHYKPNFPVAALVTARLEKYRPETEGWLRKHNIQFGRLIMLDLSSAQERRRLRANALHKATVFSQSNETLFVESDLDQASLIGQATAKAVYCTATHDFFDAGSNRVASRSLIHGFLAKESIARRALDSLPNVHIR